MKILLRFYDIGALACFLGMFGCVLIEVVSRNIIHIPTTWAEESSRLLCVWSVFLGSASAWYRGSHIIINVLLYRLKGTAKAILELSVNLLTLVFLGAVWYGTLNLMQISYPTKTTSLEISISYFYLGLFLGLTGMFVFQVRNIALIVKRLQQPAQAT